MMCDVTLASPRFVHVQESGLIQELSPRPKRDAEMSSRSQKRQFNSTTHVAQCALSASIPARFSPCPRARPVLPRPASSPVHPKSNSWTQRALQRKEKPPSEASRARPCTRRHLYAICSRPCSRETHSLKGQRLRAVNYLRRLRAALRSEQKLLASRKKGRDEDPVRRVRGRGGDGGVLRGRGGAVRALRRADPRRQQAGRQTPAPAAPRLNLNPQAAPLAALRRVPGQAGLRLLRRGQGALLRRLRPLHPRPGRALGQPPPLPRHRHPPRLRLHHRPRPQRPPPPAAAVPAAHRRPCPGRRAAGGAVVPGVPVPLGLGRRGPPPVLRLRVQRRQEGAYVPTGVQGAGVVRRHRRPVPP